MSSISQPLRVAINGGGIAGLTFALILAHYSDPSHSVDTNPPGKLNFKIDIYESSSTFSTIGAGVVLWSRTYRIVQELGLSDALDKVAKKGDDGKLELIKYNFRYGHTGGSSEGKDIHELTLPYGTMSLHRADMLKVLTDALQPYITSGLIQVHFNKKLESYSYIESNVNGQENSDDKYFSRICLRFGDGSKREADLVVGADGVRSATRASMYRIAADKADVAGERENRDRMLQHVEPSWTGTLAYRALIETEKLRVIKGGVADGRPSHKVHRSSLKSTIYLGRNKNVITYPISQGQLINVIGYVTDFDKEGLKLSQCDIPMFKEAGKEEILEHFSDWEPDVVSLFNCVEKSSRWAITVVPNLPFLADEEGRAVLIGDAAHAMTTFSGSGVGQAIEDAYILGRLLTHPSINLASISKALKIYERIRMPIIKTAMERSRMCGRILEGKYSEDAGVDMYLETVDLKDKNGPIYSGQTVEEMRKLGEKVHELWSWQWLEPFVDEDQWAIAEKEIVKILNYI